MASQKVEKIPLPRWEGWGEGEKGGNSSSYIPLPFIPSHKGRGNGTFYEFVNFDFYKSIKSEALRIFPQTPWLPIYSIHITEKEEQPLLTGLLHLE